MRKGQLNRQTQGTDQPLPHETQDRLALSPRSRRSGVGGLTHTHRGRTPARIFKDPARNLEKGSVESTHKVSTDQPLPHETQERNKDAGARDRERPGSPSSRPLTCFFATRVCEADGRRSTRSARSIDYSDQSIVPKCALDDFWSPSNFAQISCQTWICASSNYDTETRPCLTSLECKNSSVIARIRKDFVGKL